MKCENCNQAELKDHNEYFFRCPYCALLVKKEGKETEW